MKFRIILLLFFFSGTTNAFSQEFNPYINKDSLFRESIKWMPEEKKAGVIKKYNEANREEKEFLLVMLYMPRSSKKELIENIDSNFAKINYLKTEYAKLVPKGFIVDIEINPADEILTIKESIDLKIQHTTGNATTYDQEWDMEYNSAKLKEMLKPLGWTGETLSFIKRLLADAKCIGITNGDVTTIAFARSGMGMYSFKLFDHDLDSGEVKTHNDGCTYIYYKKNIVLVYGGGAIGSQCFPD